MENFKDWVREQYETNKLSGPEIVDKLFRETGERISSRHIQRIVKKMGISRSKGEAFKLSITKGKIKWLWREQKKEKRKAIPANLRYERILIDGRRCVVCGSQEMLTVTLKKPVEKGVVVGIEDLETLCWECNLGKRVSNKEQQPGVKMISNISS